MLIRHSALYTVGKLLPGLLGMATTGLLTRLLDPAAYGRYGLALVVMSFGSTLVFDWLGLAYLRVAQASAAAFGTVVWLFAGLALLLVCSGLGAWWAGLFSGPSGNAAVAGLLLMGCYAAFELAARLPVARSQPGRFLLMNAGRAMLSLAGAVGAAWLTHDAALTACGTAFGALGGLMFGGIKLTRPGFDPAIARRLLAFGLPLAVSMALAALAGSGVRALLEALASAEALGLYTAAFLIVQNTLSVVAAGIASAGYPAAVRLLDGGDDLAARQQVAANWSLLLAVLAPMALGMALTAPEIAGLLVGPAYAPAVAGLTPWLAGAGLFAGLRAHGLDHVFQLAGRSSALTGVTGLAAAVAVTLTVLLVPQWGAEGAAAASLAAALASCVLALVWGRRIWPVAFPGAATARICAACVMMAGAVCAAPSGLWLKVLAGVLAYLAGCLVFDVLGARALVSRRLAEFVAVGAN